MPEAVTHNAKENSFYSPDRLYIVQVFHHFGALKGSVCKHEEESLDL